MINREYLEDIEKVCGIMQAQANAHGISDYELEQIVKGYVLIRDIMVDNNQSCYCSVVNYVRKNGVSMCKYILYNDVIKFLDKPWIVYKFECYDDKECDVNLTIPKITAQTFKKMREALIDE